MKIAWDDCINRDRIDLVFKSRNQEFGAYVIRTKYDRTILMAFLIAGAALILFTCLPLILKMVTGDNSEVNEFSNTEVTLMQPPPIDETAPPPPPPPPPPPVQQTIKFTPPVVVKDEEVPQDEPPPTQEELKEVAAGVVTQEGDKDAIELPTEDPGAGEGPPEIFTIVEEMPSFPGGDKAMLEYLSNNIKYPSRARENGITGTVFVTFVIGKDGKVENTKLLRGIGGGCDEEALRVVNAMPPWRAGKQRGQPVLVQYNLPIRFSLK